MTSPILRPLSLRGQSSGNSKGLVLTLIDDIRNNFKSIRTDLVSTVVGDNVGGAVKSIIRDRMKKRGL